MSGSDATSCSSNPGGRWIFVRSSAGLSLLVVATWGGSCAGTAAPKRATTRRADNKRDGMKAPAGEGRGGMRENVPRRAELTSTPAARQRHKTSALVARASLTNALIPLTTLALRLAPD